MDILGMLQVLGLGTLVPYAGVACLVASGLALGLPAPGTTSGTAYRVGYGLVQWLALNKGRATNAQDVNAPKPTPGRTDRSGLPGLILCLVLAATVSLLTACASMQMQRDMPASTKAQLVVQDLETGLATANALYPVLLAACPEKHDTIKAKVGPALAVATSSVGIVRTAVDAWVQTGEEIDTQDWATMRGAAAAAVSDAVNILAVLRAEHGA